MRRTLSALASLVLATVLARPAHADETITTFVDRDDDDADGTPDLDDARPPDAPEIVALGAGPAKLAAGGEAVVRLLERAPGSTAGKGKGNAKEAAKTFAVARAGSRGELFAQAIAPGRATITVGARKVTIVALDVLTLDGAGKLVDRARSHASFERRPPERLDPDAPASSADPDALRWVVAGPREDVPPLVRLVSLAKDGAAIDALEGVPLASIACPDGVASTLVCGATPPIRAVTDDLDREHPLVRERSIKAELGGAIALASASGEKLQMIRVGGPRASAAGAIDRARARMRVLLVRGAPHGPPPIGAGDDASAIAKARGEIARANALWAACGIALEGPSGGEVEVKVVDPPRAHLLAIGGELGLPASGGVVRVRADGKEIAARVAKGTKPRGAARVIARALTAAGFTALVSDNPTIGPGAFGATDVLVRTKAGALVELTPPARGPISDDATLTAAIGRVELEDGLQHFGDVDAIAGTIEERTLLKAFGDIDPSVVEVFVVPAFAAGGRIGESFIAADGGSIRSRLIEDRAAFRADRASFALAHELGHILLDDPGHPDDYGADTPTRLMDADAANPTVFGPRRLTVAECARAFVQSGPGSPSPIVTKLPFAPLPDRRGGGKG